MTQFQSTPYDLGSSTGKCALTGAALEPGQPYMATLVEVDPAEASEAAPKQGKNAPNAEALGLRRLDVSIDAWQSGQRPPRLFSYWRTRVPEPNQKKRIFVDDHVLLMLFARLADDPRPERLAFRFVIGLILLRKKVLRYEGTRAENDLAGGELREWWMLSVRQKSAEASGQDTPAEELPEGPLEMLNPQMDEAKTQQVIEQLGEILDAEL
ncbi:MAG: hypothetical protein IT442_14430 [Phycisphaeraceae bacterium]|nr:hypothetical protein [Phycisphaeraceae bacterium]